MSELAVISVEKELNPTKEKNLFYNIVISNFIWMVFHFTVVFFFTFQLKSVALVWIFLWIWNLFSFLLDISIWIIQKYFTAKTLYVISYISEMVAIFIFAYFTFQVTWLINTNWSSEWLFWEITKIFLWEWLNLLFLLIASFCYWLTKELQDVTLISYVLNNANPNQYNGIFSKKNIFAWVWSLLWLITSWFVLLLPPIFIIILIIILLAWIIYFTASFFDNSSKSIGVNEIKNFKVLFEKHKDDHTKENISKEVNPIELKNIISQTKYLFLKPITIQSGLNIKMLITETKKEFIWTYNMLITNKYFVVYRSLAVWVIFGFWDTFAATFLIAYLDTLLPGWSYILLWIIAIPAFWLQWILWNLAQKHWNFLVSFIWLMLSWCSLVLMWIFANDKNVILLMSFALINSVWYAACMSISCSLFLDSYNKAFAVTHNLKEIDANASSAPYKIIQNLANVIWLFFWWLILSLAWYMWFFIIFWWSILYLTFWTVKNKKRITDEKIE